MEIRASALFFSVPALLSRTKSWWLHCFSRVCLVFLGQRGADDCSGSPRCCWWCQIIMQKQKNLQSWKHRFWFLTWIAELLCVLLSSTHWWLVPEPVQTKNWNGVTPSDHCSGCSGTLEQGIIPLNAEGACLGQPAQSVASSSPHVHVQSFTSGTKVFFDCGNNLLLHFKQSFRLKVFF